MTAMDAGMVIIGAGECGARAALALREHGYDGPIALIGEEAHLPYERPPLSKEAIAGADVPVAKTTLTAERIADAGIEFIGSSPAVAIERAAKNVRLADGRAIAYSKLLLATGAVPRRLPLAVAGPRVAYLRTFDDALAIRARLTPGSRVAIVGGGFIGLELAASARKRGAAVTVIEAQPCILMRGVPADIAATVHALHAANGVEIACGEGTTAIRDDGDVRIRLANERIIEADLVVIGIGAAPATALAESAGLAIDNGIAVDGRLRTSAAHIFAAGDCCSFPLALYGGRRVRLEAWRNAQEQGALAARNMLGAELEHTAVPWFWSDQYDFSLQIAGLADGASSAVRRDLGGGAFILFHLAADGQLLSASGIGPGNAVARDIRLAEMLIARQARPNPSELISSDVKLKKLLAA
ncbi:MAG TPA: FAD-dependent oxidoreductase [Pseudaminobacter sp.]|nr:FAD-dependent oxidoreductase [Pseudaminobacter sp.]